MGGPGAIVETGKHEQLMRGFAGCGAAYVGIGAAFVLLGPPVAMPHGLRGAFIALYVWLAFFAVRSLVARARGRDRGKAFLLWLAAGCAGASVMGWSHGAWAPTRGFWLALAIQGIPPALGAWLDRAGRRKEVT